MPEWWWMHWWAKQFRLSMSGNVLLNKGHLVSKPHTSKHQTVRFQWLPMPNRYSDLNAYITCLFIRQWWNTTGWDWSNNIYSANDPCDQFPCQNGGACESQGIISVQTNLNNAVCIFKVTNTSAFATASVETTASSRLSMTRIRQVSSNNYQLEILPQGPVELIRQHRD